MTSFLSAPWKSLQTFAGILKIASRSIQFRGLGSLLTILSMALGVMMVVSVLSIYGLVSNSFRANSSFGYDLLVGARGGGTQLTMSSVFYLSKPVETIPYEYYLAFCSSAQRRDEFSNSIAVRGMEAQAQGWELWSETMHLPGGSGWSRLAAEVARETELRRQREFMKIDNRGLFSNRVDFAIPILLGDTYQPEGSSRYFKVCATNHDFFKYLELDVRSHQKFQFAEGRPFENLDPQAGYFGCVLGAFAAKYSQLKLGDKIQVTHGIPGTSAAHLHEQLFEIVGIMEPTGTPHDRVVFVNMEGFYLMNDHAKPMVESQPLNLDTTEPDPASGEDWDAAGPDEVFGDAKAGNAAATFGAADARDTAQDAADEPTPIVLDEAANLQLPLPIEQRELTALLVRSYDREGFGAAAMTLVQPIEQKGGLDSTLEWSSFRPAMAQTSVQCVSPIQEVLSLFNLFVEPAKWILLALTTLICIVSGLSILVGVYNSMSQRQHEIAVMRALGARRSHVMLIMLSEACLLALAGGVLGWIAGHGLNVAMSPIVENQTGIPVRFWDVAPPEQVFSPLASLLGNSSVGNAIVQFQISPELLLIPGLMLLAVLVGVYPAITAYRTDVSKSLGK